jgi:hypothetical protein
MGTILLTGDYTGFEPGAGIVGLSVEAHVTPDRGDFAAATVTFADTISNPITWER